MQDQITIGAIELLTAQGHEKRLKELEKKNLHLKTILRQLFSLIGDACEVNYTDLMNLELEINKF